WSGQEAGPQGRIGHFEQDLVEQGTSPRLLARSIGRAPFCAEEIDEGQACLPVALEGTQGTGLGLNAAQHDLRLLGAAKRGQSLALAAPGPRHVNRKLEAPAQKTSGAIQSLLQALLTQREISERQMGPHGELERIAASRKGVRETSEAEPAFPEGEEVLPDFGQRVGEPQRAPQIPGDPQHLLVKAPGSTGIAQPA